MQYRHAPGANFADLDAVLASAPGRPSLPVRLTLELFGRCHEQLGDPGPVVVWDPCCGTGQLLTTLGLLRRDEVAALVGSDADPEPLALAARNLALLTPGGAEARAAELDALAWQHGKPGYSDAAAAARRLDPAREGPPSEVTVADAFDPAATGGIVARHRPMVVLADLPYGRQTNWAGRAAAPQPDAPAGDPGPHDGAAPDDGAASEAGEPSPEVSFVSALARVLDPAAVIAVVAQTRKVTLPPGTTALERLRVGHRAAAIVRAGDVAI
ncbi:rRNA methyltransferase [Pseudonocardia sediminis]|uniref:rRNA methyltransferase n=1 Tax=Pseudonocardia sediminis TaxID=1397368 RepID=UPI001029446C|nr:rRNA methyltransferase [Pseudonocardia sediminis]